MSQHVDTLKPSDLEEILEDGTTVTQQFTQYSHVFGDPENELLKVDPYYNIGLDKSIALSSWYSRPENQFIASNGEIGREGAGALAWKQRFLGGRDIKMGDGITRHWS